MFQQGNGFEELEWKVQHTRHRLEQIWNVGGVSWMVILLRDG
jgi:hypothetical protein